VEKSEGGSGRKRYEEGGRLEKREEEGGDIIKNGKKGMYSAEKLREWCGASLVAFACRNSTPPPF
jgi:hypothetical protein